MNEILQGLVQAFWLVISLDTELIAISLRSLYVTLTALLISTLVAFPLAALIVVTRFRFRRVVIAILNALMGLPPVVVGFVSLYYIFPLWPSGRSGLALHHFSNDHCSDCHHHTFNCIRGTPINERALG